ncbi:MAG: hypothetical protein AABY22_23410 [Nanoarchaeota archaeon]
MKKDTKLYSVMKYIYLNRYKWNNNLDISKSTGVKVKHIGSYINLFLRRVNIEKIDNRVSYKLKPSQYDYVRKILELEDEDEGENAVV